MPVLNTAAINAQADNIGTDYATANVIIYDGGTVLATHTLQGWVAAVGGVVGADNLPNTDIIDDDGTADSAKVVAGGLEMDVSVGTSNAELILSSLNYITGETSRINSLTITQPASD